MIRRDVEKVKQRELGEDDGSREKLLGNDEDDSDAINYGSSKEQ